MPAGALSAAIVPFQLPLNAGAPGSIGGLPTPRPPLGKSRIHSTRPFATDVVKNRIDAGVRLLAGAPSQYALIAAPSWKLAPSLPRKLTVPSGSLTCNATCVPAVAPRL